MRKENTKNKKPGVMVYFEILPQLEMLKPLQRLAIYDAIMAYGKDHTEPVLKREAGLAWAFIRPILDRDEERYERIIEGRSKGGKAKAAKDRKRKEEACSSESCSGLLSSAEACSTCQSTIYNPQSTISNLQSTNINLQSANINPQTPTVKERESIPGSASYQSEGFVPPSLQQVKAFVFQEGLRILPEDFVDYYTANGWRIGQQPIQDWKAVARRWSRKETDHGGNTFAGIDLGQSC